MSRCVTLHAIRTARRAKNILRTAEPVVRRTGRFVERRIVRSSVVSFVPSLLNDTLIHHHSVTPDEIFHLVTDDVSVTSLVALAMLLAKASF